MKQKLEEYVKSISSNDEEKEQRTKIKKQIKNAVKSSEKSGDDDESDDSDDASLTGVIYGEEKPAFTTFTNLGLKRKDVLKIDDTEIECKHCGSQVKSNGQKICEKCGKEI